jgi:hypothetical protein
MKVIKDPKPDGPKVEAIQEKLEISVGDTRLALPNAETLLHDVGGLAVKMYRDGKSTESVRLDFAHRKTDKLCLYFRPARDLTLTEGWKLDSADHPRCHCWASAAGSASPSSPSGSAAGSAGAGSAGSAASGSAH